MYRDFFYVELVIVLDFAGFRLDEPLLLQIHVGFDHTLQDMIKFFF